MTSTFLINLDNRPDRLAAVSARLERVGVTFERSRAVGPPECAAIDVHKTNPFLTDVEVACVASHIAVYESIIERDLPFALVLEDDVMPGRKFTRRLQRALETLPEGWMLCQLGWLDLDPISHQSVSQVARTFLGPRLARFNRLFPGRFRLGTHAYLASNSFARYGVEHFRSVSMALDLMIRDHSLCPPLVGRVFVHLPSLAGQDESPSDLAPHIACRAPVDKTTSRVPA